MTNERNYDLELNGSVQAKYAYGFDYDVIHPLMMRSFVPYFKSGNVLELGCHQGSFTKRLASVFSDITCIEASGEAMASAKALLGNKVKFFNSTFEDLQLNQSYDNIIMTHVLEHLDDPVAVLRRVRQEWLTEGGRFFLVCPNANAMSRQLAVKMSLIDHSSAVTPSELEHGHRRTYSLETLERDVDRAGLKVIHRTGIFLKPFANFQWDKILKTDIVSNEYLEACYKLGHKYPDLCSSIFLLCES